ncbi:MAG: hypothetical protein QM765_32875 [Myxococcales bacterium]
MNTNATWKALLGIIFAIATTAGLAAVMGLELQRSFDPAPVERMAVRSSLSAEPACC